MAIEPVTDACMRLNWSEYNLSPEGRAMTHKICPVTNRPIKLNRGGIKHMPRYCVVDGNRYESFHQFGTSVLKKSVSEIIELRNEHFIEKHKSTVCGYSVEMFYKCDESKKT